MSLLDILFEECRAKETVILKGPEEIVHRCLHEEEIWMVELIVQ